MTSAESWRLISLSPSLGENILSAKARHWCLPAAEGENALVLLSIRVWASPSRFHKQPLTCDHHTGLCVLARGRGDDHHIVGVFKLPLHQPAERLLDSLSQRFDVFPQNQNPVPTGRGRQLGQPWELAGSQGLLALGRYGEMLGEPGQDGLSSVSF